ncbi:PAP2 superfamily protein [Pigmentiphaga humi]|uniref:PAP2 superfamily protein n=1 Tax=Pigmentiphaga humi TaxID=2478468 RepID=A0A3P4AYW4_9BURK|nr:phosphatase PAP2 family protein [Pigmentiphaga humi]VCU68761.1 PAP2 superfamily protein [Pigmentiphaga humi]
MTTLQWLAGSYAGAAFLAWLACACIFGLWIGRAFDTRRVPPARRARTAAWLIAAGAAVFALIAVNVVTESRLVLLDHAIAQALASHASAAWLRALALLTMAGDRAFLFALGAAVLAFLLLRRRWADAGFWLAGTLGASGLNVLLKHAFRRIRPEHLHGYTQELGWSFPSGHATGSMAVYGLLAYLAISAMPAAWRPGLTMAAAALIAAIGYSRVILQVHYLSDVVAAFAVTGAWMLGIIRLRERALASSGSR